MKKIYISLYIILIFNGCESFVENTSSSISYVTDEEINDPANIPFLINGVLNDYSSAHTYVSLWADLLSDALVNDGKVQGSTDVRGEYLDNGSYDPTVGTYAPPYQAIAKVWRSANSLKLRLDLMDGDESSEKLGYYTAYLYQALPCYLLGTYYGNGPNYPDDGGATLNESAFLPSDDLYSMAIAYFDSAIVYADEHQEKIIHSLLGRQYLYEGNYSAAAQHASLGLQQSDESFNALPGEEDPWPNWYWYEAGSNRTRYTLASRFKHLLGEDFEDTNGNGVWDSTETFTDCAIIGADVGQGNGMYDGPIEPEEIVRIPLSVAAMTPGQSYSRYFQMKYPFANSPVSIIDWKETHLILAELALRGESVNVTAIDAINAVRSSHGLQSLASVDYEVLLHERDKELFCQGQRLIDQNRFSDVINWHLPDGDTWHYLPVPFEEVLNNPNYP